MDYKLSQVKTWVVSSDHKARPKNENWCETGIFVACVNLPDGPNCDGCNAYIRFEQWAKEHVYHCDATLAPGDYPAEMFEIKTFGCKCVDDDTLPSCTCGYLLPEAKFCKYSMKELVLKKPVEKDTRDASHFEILSNVPGKEQDGINKPILKLWGEVENFYGDPHKNETGRQLLLRIQDEYNISFKELGVKQQEGEWISVDPDADVADTDLQHFDEYFIVMAKNGKVTQANFCNWDTEGVANTWIINDEEYLLTFATHYQRVIYPSPPIK